MLDLEEFKKKAEAIISEYGFAFVIIDGWPNIVFSSWNATTEHDVTRIVLEAYDESCSLVFRCTLNRILDVVSTNN